MPIGAVHIDDVAGPDLESDLASHPHGWKDGLAEWVHTLLQLGCGGWWLAPPACWGTAFVDTWLYGHDDGWNLQCAAGDLSELELPS
jgi:hypothetical protein